MLRGTTTSESGETQETIDALVRRVDPDRWAATRFASPAVRARLIRLYAFVYEVARTAEAVSEPALGIIRLKWWEDQVGAIYDGGGEPAHQALAGLKELLTECYLDRSVIDAMIRARAADFENRPFHNWTDLEAYVDATAGGVIALAAQACASEVGWPPQLGAMFRAAGRAWGFTGLVRAVGVWNDRRRTFFPARLLEHVGLDPEVLFSGASTHEASAACKAVLARAANAQEEAAELCTIAPKELFPAFGYVALARRYRAQFDRPGAPMSSSQLGRQWRLTIASATGKI